MEIGSDYENTAAQELESNQNLAVGSFPDRIMIATELINTNKGGYIDYRLYYLRRLSRKNKQLILEIMGGSGGGSEGRYVFSIE